MEECKAKAKLVLLRWKEAVNKKIEKEEDKLAKAKEKISRRESIISTATNLPGSPTTIPRIIHPENEQQSPSITPNFSSQMNYAKRPFLRKTLSCTPDCETNENGWISASNSFQHNSAGSSFQNSSFQSSGFPNSNFQISSFPNSSIQISSGPVSSCPISSCPNPSLYNYSHQNSSSSFKNSNTLQIQHSVSTNLGKSDTSDGKLNSSSNIYEQSIDKKREVIRQKGDLKNLAKPKQGFVMKRLSSFSAGQNRSFDSAQSDEVQLKVPETSVQSKRERMKSFRFRSVQE